MSIEKNESIIFSAGDMMVDPANLAGEYEFEIQKRTPRSSFFNCLKNSSHQFYYIPGKNEYYLLCRISLGSKYGHGSVYSFPGCTLAIDKSDDFEKIMDTAIPHLRNFMNNKPSKSFLKQIDESGCVVVGSMGASTIPQ